MKPHTDRSHQPVSAVSAFFLGGLGVHAVGCCFALLTLLIEWNSKSYRVLPWLLMYLSLMGIPIFGLLAVIVRYFSQPWTWLTPQRGWLLFSGCLGIIMMSWFLALFMM